jgi:3-hydroxyacyl-CoA dehydrogenase
MQFYRSTIQKKNRPEERKRIVPGPVTTHLDGAIAIVAVDNPPVNALRHDVRAGLFEAFKWSRENAGVEAMVIVCTGRTFIAGADITEFGKPRQAPSLIDLVEALDAMPKLTIAAMHGTPLGGGLELALGCHFRIAAPGTRLGLPEIKLGLLPGAGGTQRLPRLVGVDKALGMILSGDPIPAKDALAAGLIDEIVEGDLTQGALAFARRVIAEKRPLERVRDLDDKLKPQRADPASYDAIIAKHVKRGRNLAAPAAAIEAVRGAFALPIEEGLKRELAAFMELVGNDQSKAQRHVFFAEREAAKVPGMPAGTKPREVARVGVIGAGTMGGGIAMSFVNAGVPVTIVEENQAALDRGLATIAKNYRTSMQRGGLTQEEMDRRMGLLKGVTSLDALSDADMVVEAVFEEMDVKKKVFGALDRIAKKGAVLATNTSYLDVNAIAAITARPQEVLGTHFFSPANVMRLLEIVRGKATAPDVLATAMAVGRRIGKVPVVVGVCHGFVGNRMLTPRGVQAERLLLEGALPQDVDAASVEFGFPMGPLAMSDLAGIDVGWRIRKALGSRAEIADALAEAGHYGQKTGRGFYIYEAGSRTPIPDPEVEAMIVAASARLGIKRRKIDKQEIVERLVFPMINEGARILDEGIALRPGDIDVIWVYGYGWPVWRGGPMYYADQVGLAYVRDQLAAYAARTGDPTLEPSPLLKQLAAETRGFGSLGAAKSAA